MADGTEIPDIRDRLARAEQDIKNQKENFYNFKTDDFGSLKREVHSMRGELNTKIDDVHALLTEVKETTEERLQSINITMAKWVGFASALIFIGQLILGKLT